MEIQAQVVTIDGVEYVTRQEAERLLSEADERRRSQMQDQINRLKLQIEKLESY
jgi:hypothetical protein